MSSGPSLESFDDKLPLNSIPVAALQAIYHAATGKTENLSKSLTGDVTVSFEDIEILYGRMWSLVEHYVPIPIGGSEKSKPLCTTTIVVKGDDSRDITYSSWEKFKNLRVDNGNITSEVLIKLEFLVHLSNTPQPQRCVVSISLDSSLPVVSGKAGQGWTDEFFDVLFLIKSDWRTAYVSIDFVDFMVAKNFVSLIEEWFGSLSHTPKSTSGNIILRKFSIFKAAMKQLGKVSASIFMIFNIIFNKKEYISISNMIIIMACALILMSAIDIVESAVTRKIFKNLASNVIPSAILLTKKDNETYNSILSSKISVSKTILEYIVFVVINITLNILASYIYTWINVK